MYPISTLYPLFPTSHGKGVSFVSVERFSVAVGDTLAAICPDIYHPAVALDGLLTRLRIPGGILNAAQCVAIADILSATGLAYIQVTNRANLQLRGLQRDLDADILRKLADIGLASGNSAIDGIRNIMLSPTAGIDPAESIDLRPLAEAWHQYLTEHPELSILSTKFSVGFDGGGSVGIIDRPNDITLLAISDRELSLYLAIGDRGAAPVSVGVELGPDECLPMLAAIAQSYRQGVELLDGDTRRKPRLRDVIRHYGLSEFIEIVRRELAGSRAFIFKNLDGKGGNHHTAIDRYSDSKLDLRAHLGVHRQREIERYYLGVVLPLGRWMRGQVEGLGSISDRYGNGTIRLTPWQNLIVPDIAESDIATVQGLINDLGLVQIPNHPSSLLRACAGNSGCQFSATDTQTDAIALSDYLASKLTLDRPINIHFTGCDKSCAQHDRADIALWGYQDTPEGTGRYRLCVNDGTGKFGRTIRDNLNPEDVPIAIDKLIRSYHHHRTHPNESFAAFIQK
jgi:ferredoxin-nitrite reductase